MKKPKIIVKNLNVWLHGEHILKKVNIEIPRKKISAIIGPSGCGKTTLFKCFNRLIDLTSNVKIEGEIRVDGKNIFDPDMDIVALRKKMGLLLQNPTPLPMSIYDNVAYGPRIHGNKKKKSLDKIVEKYLTITGLWGEVKDRLDQPATDLSIGQQQRMCLARGLAVEPKIILCDEPTSALGPVATKKIERLLKKLKKDYTIILVTHFVHQAERVADFVNFIYLGKIIESGSKKDVFENPKKTKTKKYIKSGMFE